MKAAPWIAGTVGICTLFGIAYSVLNKGGFVISESDAAEIVQSHAAVEAEKRERGDLLTQRDLKFNRLTLLSNITRTPDQDLEMAMLREDVRRINDRLAELDRS